MNQRKSRQHRPKGSSGSSSNKMFRKIFRRNEILLITDKKRTHSQDIRHRRRIYNIIQFSRVPLLAFAGLCWMMWGLWWLAAIIFIISIPLPWIAVVIANARGEPRDPRERAVYKPALIREMNEQLRLEAERARELEAGSSTTEGKEVDRIRRFEGITIDADEDLEEDNKNDS